MKKLMSSTTAKIIGYILLAVSGIISVTSGLGIYSAIVLRFYNMEYYKPDKTLIVDTQEEVFYENLRIMIFNFKYELIAVCILATVILLTCFVFFDMCSRTQKRQRGIMCRGIY